MYQENLDLERLIEALNRTRRQQEPLEPVVPDPHTPDPDGLGRLEPLRGGRSSSSRQAAQTTASPVLVRMLDAPMARAARSAVSEPPP